MTEVSFVGYSGRQWTYDDEARIGKPSGFGAVFRGREDGGAEVAVKRVGPEGGQRRRNRELEIGTLVSHSPSEHLVPIIDHGDAGSDLLIVMPMATESLDDLIESGSLDMAQALRILRQIAQGLKDLSELGIFHRDLKPGNILRFDETWRLADFGISRDLTEATATEGVTFKGWGTKEYLAPEVWNNGPTNIKTDLYALGVISYELLAGERPFDGGSDAVEWRRLHLTEAPPTPPAEIPPGIRRLMVRLLAKDPDQRPSDAGAVIDLIDKALARHLDPIQGELESRAFAVVSRQAQRASATALELAQQEEVHKRRIQALSDLEEIVADAAELADALDNVTLTGTAEQWSLDWDGQANVLISVFSELKPSHNPKYASAWRRNVDHGSEHNVVAAGVVKSSAGTSPEYGEFPVANIVCLYIDGRLCWSCWRFSANTPRQENYVAYETRTKLGPLDRPHGFIKQNFEKELPYALTPLPDGKSDIWTLIEEELTSNSVLAILMEAMDSL